MQAGAKRLTVLNLDSVPGEALIKEPHRRGGHSHRAGGATLKP